MTDHQKKWKKLSLWGVALVGLGINFVAEATILKGATPPDAGFGYMATWFWPGLFGIAAINAGICCVAEAVKHRIYHDHPIFKQREE